MSNLPNPLIRIERAMNNKEIAQLLKDALLNGDSDAVWFAIGELEKSDI
jgi:hypothetical protein